MFKKKNKSTLSESDMVYLQNSVKTLAANIRFTSVDDPIKIVGVTSSVPNEGKTTVSYLLGQAMASGGGDVLLVNCDFRHRSLAKKAHVHSQKGLYAVLSGQCELSDAVVPLEIPGLYLLDVEPGIPNPVDVLASRRFYELMQRVRGEYGFVIIDTPPLSAFVDAAVVSRIADGMLLVVREGFTKREELLAAYDQLLKADANVIGSVLNFCSAKRSSHYYYYNYYNSDGKKIRGSSRKGKRAQEAVEEVTPAVRWDAYVGEEAAGKTNVMAPLPVKEPAFGARHASSSPSATDSPLLGEGLESAGEQPTDSASSGVAAPVSVRGLDAAAKPKSKGKSKNKSKNKSKGKDKDDPERDPRPEASEPANLAPKKRASIDDTTAFLALVGYGANASAQQ